MSLICSSFHFRVKLVFQHNWKQSNKNLSYYILPHSNRKLGFTCFSHEGESPYPAKINQSGYDPSEELFGLGSDSNPRESASGASKPRSWFGPNGQYIRELPCPSCRGRGYTPCTECGIERSRLDCSLCSGKGIITCHQCSGDCVVWEESIDERPWEKAQSMSPFKVEDDDEVDSLDIELDEKRKTKRVYQSPSPEVNMKISRSLKSLNAKTGLFSNRMKIIHRDPMLHAQRVAAIKKAKRKVAARKKSSEAMKNYFRDPENRRKRSLSMKAAKYHCGNCGQEGHRAHYCPELKNIDRRYKCQVCGKMGHNRRTCPKMRIRRCAICKQSGHYKPTCPERAETEPKQKSVRHCRLCGQAGHNRLTCGRPVVPKEMGNRRCSICQRRGHYRLTCPERSRTELVAKRVFTCKWCGGRGHNIRTCTEEENKYPRFRLIVPRRELVKVQYCNICGQEGHNRRTCPMKDSV